MKEKKQLHHGHKDSRRRINGKDYSKLGSSVRFQRPAPVLTAYPATRFCCLSGENGMVCVIAHKAAISALTDRLLEDWFGVYGNFDSLSG